MLVVGALLASGCSRHTDCLRARQEASRAWVDYSRGADMRSASAPNHEEMLKHRVAARAADAASDAVLMGTSTADTIPEAADDIALADARSPGNGARTFYERAGRLTRVAAEACAGE